MEISNSLLDILLKDITLLHVLILLGIPYLVFYIFEKFTKFDKFFEKWEGALFIFSIGGFISFLCLIFQEKYNIPFLFSYFLLIIILCLILWILALKQPTKKFFNGGWIKLKLTTNEFYTGINLGQTPKGLWLGATLRDSIVKELGEDSKNIIAKKIFFRWEAIQAVLYF